MGAGIFPPGFPSELAAAARVHSSEAAWRPSLAVKAIEWLGGHGYAVLGTEVLRPEREGIQSLPYFQSVDRQENEDWNSFVTRAAAETIRYLRVFEGRLSEEGNVYVNLTWASDSNPKI